MTLPTLPTADAVPEVERIVDTAADVTMAWIAMCAACAKLAVRLPLIPFGGYSVAAEAAELLRARQTDGGAQAQQ